MIKRKKIEIRKSELIFFIFLLQCIMGYVVMGEHVGENISKWQTNRGTLILYMGINAGGIFTIKYFLDLLNQEMEHQRLLIELQKSNEVLTILRAHKHDFFNHLQVISGLAQLGKTDRIVSYIQSISNNVSQSYEIANIDVPEIAIVLMQKLGEANNKGIQVESNIDTRCEGLKGEGITYAQILFNLLDNAIYELEKVEAEKKLLKVEIHEQAEGYQFVIYNNLPIILEKDIDHVFEQGFTTKQGDHDGLGLWNVHKLVKMNDGKIKVKSMIDYGTSFKVTFPTKRLKG